MASFSPNETEQIQLVVRNMLRSYYTILPGVVSSYDAKRQTVDVVPFHKVPHANGRTGHDDLPPLPDVPLLVQASAASGQTIKLAAGDTVLLLISMFSLDEFINSQSQSAAPADPRQQDLHDAFALPFVRSPAPSDDAADSDRSIEGDDVRLGHANDVERLMQWTSAFQAEFDQWVTSINSAVIAANAARAVTGAVAAAGTYTGISIAANKPTLIKTTHTKGS
jgi:hypothetical protein